MTVKCYDFLHNLKFLIHLIYFNRFSIAKQLEGIVVTLRLHLSRPAGNSSRLHGELLHPDHPRRLRKRDADASGDRVQVRHRFARHHQSLPPAPNEVGRSRTFEFAGKERTGLDLLLLQGDQV